MKKLLLTLTIATMVSLPQCVSAQHAVTVLNPQSDGEQCEKSDYTFFQGYRAFWSYVIQKKPSNYPGYWALVPEIYVNGYGGSVCKNVVNEGYGQFNLAKKGY